MPRLQQAIKDALPSSELLTNLTADEVIAVGCSNQAALMGEPWDVVCQYANFEVPAISKEISVRVSIQIMKMFHSLCKKFISFLVSVWRRRRESDNSSV